MRGVLSEPNKRFNESRAIAIVAIVDTREIDRELFVVARFLTNHSTSASDNESMNQKNLLWTEPETN